MPKTARQLEKIKAERKDQIVLAGLKVFCEKGYDGAKVDDIVKKAGCSHGLFYHYFRNKQEIFDEIMKNANNDTYEVVEKYISSGTGEYREKLKNLLTYIFNKIYSNENFSYYFFFFISRWFLKVNADDSLTSGDLKKPLPRLFMKFFADGQAAGEFTDRYSAENCCTLLLSVIQGYSLNNVLISRNIERNPFRPNIDFIVGIFEK